MIVAVFAAVIGTQLIAVVLGPVMTIRAGLATAIVVAVARVAIARTRMLIALRTLVTIRTVVTIRAWLAF